MELCEARAVRNTAHLSLHLSLVRDHWPRDEGRTTTVNANFSARVFSGFTRMVGEKNDL